MLTVAGASFNVFGAGGDHACDAAPEQASSSSAGPPVRVAAGGVWGDISTYAALINDDEQGFTTVWQESPMERRACLVSCQ